MIEEIPTVLGAVVVERRHATVILRLHTDAGRVALRLTPATAQLVGTELRLKAVQPAAERPIPSTRSASSGPSAPNSALRTPLQKPGGGIL